MTSMLTEIRPEPRVEGDGIVIEVPAWWAANGERRIGYASIMRLVEVVRELHWSRDVEPLALGGQIDSITRRIQAEFLAPFLVNEHVHGHYRVRWCRQRSYGLQVSFSSQRTGKGLARVDLICVFFDPVRMSSTTPPDAILKALRGSAARFGSSRMRSTT